MSYDALDGYVVLFGGDSGKGTCLNDTWTFHLGVWTNLTGTTTTTPEARSDASMAFDPSLSAIVLFGGYDCNKGTILSDTWEFSGGKWTVASGSAPPGRGDPGLAYDAVDGYLLLYGGVDVATGQFYSDTWKFTASGWAEVMANSPVTARASPSMVFDTSDNYVLLFGGSNSSGAQNGDTWKYTGGTWTQLSPSLSPSARATGPGVTYDSTGGYVLLFGGCDSTCGAGTELNDSWTFAGGTWTNISKSLAISPPARGGATMAYDSSDGYDVLFGGGSMTITALGDTWTYLTSPTPVLSSTTVTPPSSTLSFGGTEFLNATAYDQSGKSISGATFAWSNPYPSSLGTLSAFAGSQVSFTAGSTTGNGHVCENATYGGATLTACASIAVASTLPVLTSTSVTPSAATIQTGGIQPFVATALNQTGASIPGAAFLWSNPFPATLGILNVTTGSQVTFTAGGSAGAGHLCVNATYNGATKMGCASISVVTNPPVLSSTNVTPPSSIVQMSQPLVLTATAYTASGSVIGGATFAWSSPWPSSLGSLSPNSGTPVTFASGTTVGTGHVCENASYGGLTAMGCAVITVTTSGGGASYPVFSDNIARDGFVNTTLLAFDSPAMKTLMTAEVRLGIALSLSPDALDTPLSYTTNGLYVLPVGTAGIAGFSGTTPLVAPFEVTVGFTPEQSGNQLVLFFCNPNGGIVFGALVDNGELFVQTENAGSLPNPVGTNTIGSGTPGTLSMAITPNGFAVYLNDSGGVVAQTTSLFASPLNSELNLTAGSMEGGFKGEGTTTGSPSSYLTNLSVRSTLYSSLTVTAEVRANGQTNPMSNGQISLNCSYYGFVGTYSTSTGTLSVNNLREGLYTVGANESQSGGGGTVYYAAVTASLIIGIQSTIQLIAQAPPEQPITSELTAANTQGGTPYVGMSPLIDNLITVSGGGTGSYAVSWHNGSASCKPVSGAPSEESCEFTSSGTYTLWPVYATVSATGTWFGSPSNVPPTNSETIVVVVTPTNEIANVSPVGPSPFVGLAYENTPNQVLIYQAGQTFYLNSTITDNANVLTMPDWAQLLFGVSSAWQGLSLTYGGAVQSSLYFMQPGGSSLSNVNLTFPSTATQNPPTVGSQFGIVLDPTSLTAELGDIMNVALTLIDFGSEVGPILKNAGLQGLLLEIIETIIDDSIKAIWNNALVSAINQQSLVDAFVAYAYQLFVDVIHVFTSDVGKDILSQLVSTALVQSLLVAIGTGVGELAVEIGSVIGILIPVAKALVDLACIISTMWAGPMEQDFTITHTQPQTTVTVQGGTGSAPMVEVKEGNHTYGRSGGWIGGAGLVHSDFTNGLYSFSYPSSANATMTVTPPANSSGLQNYTLTIYNGTTTRQVNGTVAPGGSVACSISHPSGRLSVNCAGGASSSGGNEILIVMVVVVAALALGTFIVLFRKGLRPGRKALQESVTPAPLPPMQSLTPPRPPQS